MSEFTPPTELEASEAAIKLANEYREKQRKEAEKYRETEVSETEEDFLERVRLVSENSPGGFSAPYVRPLETVVDEDETTTPTDVEEKLEDEIPTGLVASGTTGNVELSDLIEPGAEARALFGQQDADPSAEVRSGIEAQDPILPEDETPRPEGEQSDSVGTEVEANDNTTIVDTGYTEPGQIEAAQSVVNAKLDAEAEENGDPKPSLGTDVVDHVDEGESDTDEVEDESKELSYQDKFKAIKDASSSDEVDQIIKGDDRKPLVAAAKKRKEELAS